MEEGSPSTTSTNTRTRRCRLDHQQPPSTIAHDQLVAEELDAHRPTASVRHGPDLEPVRVESEDPPVTDPSDDPSARVDDDVFGTVTVERDRPDRRQRLGTSIGTGPRWRRRRVPDDRTELRSFAHPQLPTTANTCHSPGRLSEASSPGPRSQCRSPRRGPSRCSRRAPHRHRPARRSSHRCGPRCRPASRHEFAFASMDPDPDVDAQSSHGFAQRDAASDRSGGSVERCERSVSGAVELPAAEPLQVAAHEGLVALQQQRHAASPMSTASWVDPTMSTKRTVVRTRSAPRLLGPR